MAASIFAGSISVGAVRFSQLLHGLCADRLELASIYLAKCGNCAIDRRSAMDSSLGDFQSRSDQIDPL